VRTNLSYFSLLGISEDAGQEELEERYRVLADYLASPTIPASLRDWANKQAALVDEAYAVLADPERRAAARRQQQPAKEEARTGSETDQRAEAGAREERRGEEGRGTEAQRPAREAPEPSGYGLFDRLLNLRSQPLVLGPLIGLVVIAAVLFGRYGLPGRGGGTGGTPSTAQQNTLIPLDTERVAQLMAEVQLDPNNKDALFELGERYFEANEWQSSIDWLTKLLAVDSTNTYAQTDIGTANFNLGLPDVAKTAWLAVLQIDPNYVQAHYNLGFLYANIEPVDLAAARQEWQKVVELAPGSDLASTAQVHLDGLSAPTPAAGASTQTTPAASAAP
jgi:tetratricopeptide (TPR) repeat protein